MVLPAIAGIARFVAAATPAAFAIIDRTCAILETEAGGIAGEVVSEKGDRARTAIIALRAACDTRKALTRKRRRRG